jgi:hypothetical protein
MAFPIPREAPVTRATFCSLPVGLISSDGCRYALEHKFQSVTATGKRARVSHAFYQSSIKTISPCASDETALTRCPPNNDSEKGTLYEQSQAYLMITRR